MLTAVLVLLLVGVTALLLYLLYQNVSLRSAIETRAREQFIQWRDNELQDIRRQYEAIAQKEADARLLKWKQENTATIRREAVEKSRAVTLGKVTEHVVPFLPGFQHNPKDARFIGTPVDFIIFDGLDEGGVRQIAFVEVKTGSSSLSKRERQIRDAVKQRLVVWEELRIPGAIVQDQPAAQPSEALSLPLSKACPRCDSQNRAQALFCGHCGAQLS